MGKIPHNAEAEAAIEQRAQELHEEIQEDIWQLWRGYQQAEEVLDQTLFYRTTSLTMLHISAILAVDVGITMEQFVAMSKTMWEDIQASSPKLS